MIARVPAIALASKAPADVVTRMALSPPFSM